MTQNAMAKNTVNLFVYGSLREPSIFESVCGFSFSLKPSELIPQNVLLAELAMLPNYRRVSPDNIYFYAIPDSTSKIQGFVVYNIPPAAMDVIDKYEGKHYDRETVKVNTANGPIEAHAYLASPKSMKKRFGDRFHVNLIHELWLRKRIEKFFDTHTRPGEKSPDANIERMARRELVGTTERDLVVSHLGQEAVSDYYLEHELNRPVPSIRPLMKEASAAPYIENYLAMVIKQSLLNHFESLIRERFRFELNRLTPNPRYYNHSLSMLFALRMVNRNHVAVDMILRRGLETMPPDGQYDLMDYVKYAISAAENTFDPRVVQGDMHNVHNNLQPGLMPMGAEVELSNLGFRAVDKTLAHQDPVFDGFRYFSDFSLDVLTWRLGGYVDDHSGEPGPGKRGFFELAPGRLNTLGEISKPASPDPWVINQLIHEIVCFYPINPHSLHLSFQLRHTQVNKQTILPMSFAKCLFVLGGGTQITSSGRLGVSRMIQNEIQRSDCGEELIFARTSKRHFKMTHDAALNQNLKHPAYINQYKFMRLESRANYEPLIMALKGLQLSLNPGNYLTAEQLSASRRLRSEYRELREWAANPEPISRRTKGRFLDAIYDGLMHEAHRRPYHKLHYIDWTLGAIDMQIRLFNKKLEESTKNTPNP